MRSHPVANSAPVSLDDDVTYASCAGADLTYMVSRALGYAALLAFSVFVVAQLI